MKKTILLILSVAAILAINVPAFPAAGDYFFKVFTSTTGEVSGSMDNAECADSPLSSKDGWSIVKDGSTVEFWSYDYDSTTAEDATHVHCKSGAWTQGVWTHFASATAGTGTVDTSGTPEANDIPRFTDVDTIEGLSYDEFRAAVGFQILADCSGITAGICLQTDGDIYYWDGDSAEIFTGGSTFDQDLNTTDDVEFNSVVVAGSSTNGGLEIDPLPDTTQTCEGIIVTITAGATLSFGEAIGIDTDSKWVKANANAGSIVPARAIVCEDGVVDDSIQVLLRGFLRDDSAYDFDMSGSGSRYILLGETAGALIMDDGDTVAGVGGTIPDDTGDAIQPLGVSFTDDVWYFNPQLVPTILE